MTAADSGARRALADLGFGSVLAVLIALTAIRIMGLYVSSVDLFLDEAQYWDWSRELAFGYFSKPPLLAWIIAAFEPVCGSSEACARMASPVIYLATSLVVYAIANELYGRTAAAWSALAFAFATGLIFSARIISTDVPLILFWAMALLAYLKLLPAPDWRWAIVLGIALGLGMLAKYAMIYFVMSAICAALVDREAWAFLKRPQTWIALLIALLIFSPNIYWNVANGFVTVKHTGDNISGAGIRFQPGRAAEFFGAQFAVAGPVVFATFLIILVKLRDAAISKADRLMLAFAVPTLVLIVALSFFRGANANWAAPAILSMTVLAAAWWARRGWQHALTATLALGVTMQALLLVGDAYAYRISIAALGSGADIYKRTLGWRELGGHVAAVARKIHAPTVVGEGRAELAELIFYLRNEPVRVLSWPAGTIPDDQFDLTRALDDKTAVEPVLFISQCAVISRFKKFYSEVEPLGLVPMRTGPTTGRQFYVTRLAGRRQPIGPLGPCLEIPGQ
jgi:4-amino-4-deoxy-L-arabinose transferase-like glycosyltransferase